MKSSRMKFAKKLKSIKAGEYLNQDRILQVISAADGISELLPKMTAGSIWRSPLKLEEEHSTFPQGNEENVQPPVNHRAVGRKSIIGSGFRRPDLNSTTLFDPKLLEAFEMAVVCLRRLNIESRFNDDQENDIFFPAEEDDTSLPHVRKGGNVICKEGGLLKDDALLGPLVEFEERCPPGGEESVVFYTTTLRGIRKTFDDCNMIRFLLDSFKVKYYERDVSMHRQYREELRRISASEAEVLPPVLCIKGRYIGGAQRVLSLHEQGKLRPLFDGVPITQHNPCQKCNGFRFLMCDGCRGSRRIVSSDGTCRIQCLLCNENGLLVCSHCS